MSHHLKKVGVFTLSAITVATLGISTIDACAKTVSYTVQAGDTLGKITREAGVSVEKLQAESGIADPNKIYVGQTIVIDLNGITEAGQKWVADQQKKGNVIDGIVKSIDYKNVGKSIEKNVKLPKGTTLEREELGFLYETFDEKYYAEQYPDVKTVFGNNKMALFQHWITYGANEGREITPEFSVNAYVSANKDIQKAFGKNPIVSLVHYYKFGQHEERITTVKEAVAAGIIVTTPGGGVVATPTPYIPPAPALSAPAAPSAPVAAPETPRLRKCVHNNFHIEADAPDDPSDEFDYLICDDCDLTMFVAHDWVDGSCQSCSKPHDHTGEEKIYYPVDESQHSVVYAECYGDVGLASHNWNVYGICDDCEFECVHNYVNGVCAICSKTCEHNVTYAANIEDQNQHKEVCSECGKDCGRAAHTWSFGACADCGYYCEHGSTTSEVPAARNDSEHNIVCDVCGEIVRTDYHYYGEDHVCSVCGYTHSMITHIYENSEFCVICDKQCEHNHSLRYEEIDGDDDVHRYFCSVCNYDLTIISHEYDDNGVCLNCHHVRSY